MFEYGAILLFYFDANPKALWHRVTVSSSGKHRIRLVLFLVILPPVVKLLLRPLPLSQS